MQHLAGSNERLRNQKRMLEEDLVGQTQQKKRLKADANMWMITAHGHIDDFQGEREIIRQALSRVLDRLHLHTPFVQRDLEMQLIINHLQAMCSGISDGSDMSVESETEGEDA